MTQTINLFWRQTRNPSLMEQEKENNVTHAFLILLLKNHELLNQIFKQLGMPLIDKSSKEVLFQISNKHKHKTLDSKNKYILFISSKYNSLEDNNLCSIDKKRDIPDGLILDKNTSILIESKVSALKSQSQINRYNRIFFKGLAIIKYLTWEDIYTLVAQYTSRNKPLEGYLSSQFKEYMEVVHLNGFSGIPFFDKNEVYTQEDASFIMKYLIKDLKEKDWFQKKGFTLRERPKTSPWDFWHYKDIKEDNPRKFPHYSIYIFDDFLGIDCLFHKKELLKIINDENLFRKFKLYLLDLSKKSPDYYFRAVHYKKLQNKNENKGVRQGASYHDLEFTVQLKSFIKNHVNWEKQLRNYLGLLVKEEVKQFSIIKKAHYKDKIYANLTKPTPCFGFIKETIDETIGFYDLMYNLYRNR